jgi:hypothetical protein
MNCFHIRREIGIGDYDWDAFVKLLPLLSEKNFSSREWLGKFWEYVKKNDYYEKVFTTLPANMLLVPLKRKGFMAPCKANKIFFKTDITPLKALLRKLGNINECVTIYS